MKLICEYHKTCEKVCPRKLLHEHGDDSVYEFSDICCEDENLRAKCIRLNRNKIKFIWGKDDLS